MVPSPEVHLGGTLIRVYGSGSSHSMVFKVAVKLLNGKDVMTSLNLLCMPVASLCNDPPSKLKSRSTPSSTDRSLP